jgi:hypothetical protein
MELPKLPDPKDYTFSSVWTDASGACVDDGRYLDTGLYERARADYWEARARLILNAIKAHNDGCEDICGRGDQEGVTCGYRPYFPRHCPDCPRRGWMITDDNCVRLDLAIGKLPGKECS